MADILASVSVALGADISAFKAGMAAARKELRGLIQTGEAMKDIGKQLSLFVTAPLAALGLSVAKVGADFEAAFNRVEAATQASGTELESLKAKAKGIALDPKLQFSAIDAAQALENLAKNGLTTAQILGGAADASTNLATATGGNLATAADITTDVMNNFGKAASEAAQLVSNITGTTIASKLSIDEYRQALGQAGGVAGQLGVRFEDFNAALAVTSSGFSSGSDAGTSFKTFLQRLVPQSKEAAAAMKKLGLNFFDAQGQMKPLREIAGDLQKAFKGLSDQQRNQLGTEIFGADSIRTALLLAKDGAEGFDKMAASIGKVDAAAQGSILNKGFVGGIEAFKSAFEGLQIAIADSGILNLADVFVRAGAEMLGSLAQLNPGLLQLATIVGAVVAAVGPLSYAIGVLASQLPLLKTGFSALQAAFAGALGPIGLTVLAIAALAAGLIYLNGASDRAVDAFNKQATSTQALNASVTPLVDRYEELKAKTTLTAAEQEELRSIVEKIAQQVPSATTAVDAYGKATAISAEKTRDWLTALREQEKQLAIAALPDQQKKLQQLSKEYAYLTRQIDTFNKTGKIQFFEDGKIKEAGAGSKAMQELQLAAANTNVALQEQRTLVDKLLASTGRFGEVLPGFEKYGRLALEGADYIRSFGEAAEGAAGKVGNLLTAEQTKALEKFLQAVRTNENQARALGASYDFVGERQKVFATGIKELTDAGFTPAQLAARGYSQELILLNSILSDTSKIASGIPEGLENLSPTLGINVKLNPLEDNFTQQMKKALADLSLFVPPLNTNEFDESAAFFEGTALRIQDTVQNLELPPLPPLPGFDTAALQASVQPIQDITSTVVNSFTGMSNATVARMTEFNTAMNGLLEQLNESVAPLLAGFAGQFADAFGSIIAGTASAGGAFQQLFSGILGSLAGFMGDFGKQLIAIGIGKLSLDSLFAAGPAGGPAAIAAGVGLVALAGIAKAFSAKAAGNLSGITGAGGGSSFRAPAASSLAPPPGRNTPPAAPNVTITHIVEMTQRGTDLVNVLQLQTTRNGRVLGTGR